MPSVRRLVASLSLVVVVPVCVVLAYAGHAMGLYSFLAVPMALAVLLAAATAILFVFVSG